MEKTHYVKYQPHIKAFLDDKYTRRPRDFSNIVKTVGRVKPIRESKYGIYRYYSKVLADKYTCPPRNHLARI